MTIEDAKRLAEKEYPSMRATMGLDLPTRFVFVMKDRKLQHDAEVLDSFYSVDKKAGTVSGFSPMMDIENFKNAMKSPIEFKDEPIKHSSMTGNDLIIVDGTLYLEHHGVKGQKHGVRRYQYEDGTLTPLGRIHYGYGKARSTLAPVTKAVKKTGQAASIVTKAFKGAYNAGMEAGRTHRERKLEKQKEKASKDRSTVLKNKNLFTTAELEQLEKRFTAEDKMRSNIPDKKALRKAMKDEKEAEKLADKKERASRSRESVLKNKRLFTDEELKALSDRFNTEDKIKQDAIDKGLAAVKNLSTIATNLETVNKAFESISGTYISPVKRQQAELEKAQKAEDRQRKQQFENAEEARKQGKYKAEISGLRNDEQRKQAEEARKQAKEQREANKDRRDIAAELRKRKQEAVKEKRDEITWKNDEQRKNRKDFREQATWKADEARKRAKEIRDTRKETAEEQRKKATFKKIIQKQDAETKKAQLQAVKEALDIADSTGLTPFEQWLKTIDPNYTRHSSFDSDYVIQNGVLLIGPNGSTLSHHGIEGQRWGFRRFQNHDGSLTKAGRIRYGLNVPSDYRQQPEYNKKDKTQDPRDDVDEFEKLEEERLKNRREREEKLKKAKDSGEYDSDFEEAVMYNTYYSWGSKGGIDAKNRAYKKYLNDPQKFMAKANAKERREIEKNRRTAEKYKKQSAEWAAKSEQLKNSGDLEGARRFAAKSAEARFWSEELSGLTDYREKKLQRRVKHSSMESDYIIQNGVLMVNPTKRR